MQVLYWAGCSSSEIDKEGLRINVLLEERDELMETENAIVAIVTQASLYDSLMIGSSGSTKALELEIAQLES